MLVLCDLMRVRAVQLTPFIQNSIQRLISVADTTELRKKSRRFHSTAPQDFDGQRTGVKNKYVHFTPKVYSLSIIDVDVRIQKSGI